MQKVRRQAHQDPARNVRDDMMTLEQLAKTLDCEDDPSRLFLRAEVTTTPDDLLVYISPIASIRFGAATGYMVWGFEPELDAQLRVLVYAMVLIDDIEPVRDLAKALTLRDATRLLRTNPKEAAVAE